MSGPITTDDYHILISGTSTMIPSMPNSCCFLSCINSSPFPPPDMRVPSLNINLKEPIKAPSVMSMMIDVDLHFSAWQCRFCAGICVNQCEKSRILVIAKCSKSLKTRAATILPGSNKDTVIWVLESLYSLLVWKLMVALRRTAILEYEPTSSNKVDQLTSDLSRTARGIG